MRRELVIMILKISLIASLFCLTGCKQASEKLLEAGVSKELAQYRKGQLSDVEYSLYFSIPLTQDSSIDAKLTLTFNLLSLSPVILDFAPYSEFKLSSAQEVANRDNGLHKSLIAKVNGKVITIIPEREHLLIPSRYLKAGKNSIEIDFIAGESSLNRRENLLYTLLVPDRARTLFPCFDQPDIKALYTLSLDIPLGWVAVANGQVQESDTAGKRVSLLFSQTEPISTYLFSFVAGEFKEITGKRGNRSISIFHRESDPYKESQCNLIFDQLFYSLDWLEDYTGIAYPFRKYDIVIVPGFQYGGMEHVGATLYSDRTMFLDKSATITDELARASLIAHETAHMWFGDYVTMPWFDDVWIKEVFANWFASQIVSPQFPEINHRLNFINKYYPASYQEDRGPGSNSVQQNLDNLNNAGLVYGNIIYNKAPIVMEKLVHRVGPELFRKGVQSYLNRYAYSNASWDQLIEILDSLSTDNLTKWSDVWIKERGRPHIIAKFKGDTVLYTESDPLGRGITWGQDILSSVVPNSDGLGYALFVLDTEESERVTNLLISGRLSDDVTRLSVIINLYENLWAQNITEEFFADALCRALVIERNPIIFSRITSYLTSELLKESYGKIGRTFWDITLSLSDIQLKTMAFNGYIDVASCEESALRLYRIWSNPEKFTDIKLGERDLMRLSYELALRFPERWSDIRSVQLSRLSGFDRKREFLFVYPSTSSSAEIRDSVFFSLLSIKNRGVEPWAATALAFLNHRLREESARSYIQPGLEIIEEIQRSGDIFFPVNWLRSLLRGHSSAEASEIVSRFLKERDTLHPMLRQKVLQQSYHLLR
ncbi:MAG: M1 family aminopeptidase [Bacteroidales bacterium]|nr:M1 family aminopeptidase [Bacteroidales bacterium]